MKENPNWLTQDVFHDILESKYGKLYRVKSFVVESIEDPWDKTPTYRIQIDTEFKVKSSSSIFGCGSKKSEESVSYLVRMSPEREIETYDKVIPVLEKLYFNRGRQVSFTQKREKLSDKKALLFEDPKSKCIRKIKDFQEDHLKKVLEKLSQFHAASAVYAETNTLESFTIKVEKAQEILEVFDKKVKPTIIKIKEGENLSQKFFSQEIIDHFDSKEFNVLNHGQCWPNNILFTDNDEIQFTDFSSVKFGSPALDLYYFLLSATSTTDKTRKFDYFIKIYYDYLVDNLKYLGYKKEVPYLTDLRISLLKHSIWARIAICGVVSISLSEKKGDLYTNERYVKVLEELLPWMDHRGLLEHKETKEEIVVKEEEVAPSVVNNNESTENPRNETIVVEVMEEPHQKEVTVDVAPSVVHNNESTENPRTETIVVEVAPTENPKIPKWIKAEYFNEIVRKEMGGFTKITKFEPVVLEENYSSLQIKINIEAELEGVANSAKNFSYILKTTNENDDVLGLFNREKEVYNHILPLFENLYKQRNINVKFAPKTLKLSNNPGVVYLLFKDVKELNFKNADKFDNHHIENVLEYMAKFHAASTVAFETIKPYSDSLTIGFFDKRIREIFVESNKQSFKVLKDTFKNNFENGQYYSEKLVRNIYDHFDELIDFYKVKNHEFNVLNLGYCWYDNVFFKYNQKNEIDETVFLDFSNCKYASPVADLYHFLLSSAAIDIKVKKFDYFIRFYHEQLVENLETLRYPKPIPTLTELHSMLIKNSVVARNVLCGGVSASLLNSHKPNWFINPEFKGAVNELLIWMDNKGLLG